MIVIMTMFILCCDQNEYFKYSGIFEPQISFYEEVCTDEDGWCQRWDIVTFAAFPAPDVNRLLTWPQVHIFRQPVNDQIWVRKKPDSSPGSSGAAAPFDTLDVEARTRWPKIQSILLSPSSAQHPYQRVGSVERRRLPLVAAVQWRIVSLSNQRLVLDLPFSPSLQTLSRLYDASYATNAEENALRSEWIGETYAVRLVSPPLHCFIGREWGRMEEAASHDCGTIQN